MNYLLIGIVVGVRVSVSLKFVRFCRPLANDFKVARTNAGKRDKLLTLQWSQSSEIMGGYNTPDSMVRDRTYVCVYHEITDIWQP